jgi:uncharacterized protein
MERGEAVKPIDLTESVYALTERYPELIDLLVGQGFLGVRNPVIRGTLGRKMTIPEGCRRQGKELGGLLWVLAEHGFSPVGAP